MPSRNIAVQKTVYDALTKEKRAGESYTGVIRRLLAQQGGLEELHGAWGRSGAAESRRRLRGLRSSSKGRR